MYNKTLHQTPEAGAFLAFAISEQNVAFARSSLASGAGDLGYIHRYRYHRMSNNMSVDSMTQKDKDPNSVFEIFIELFNNFSESAYQKLEEGNGVKSMFDPCC